MTVRDAPVLFQLLGPVEMISGDRRAELGAPQQRTVLACLAVDAGRPVSLQTLVDRIWGDLPPAGARASLYAHMTRIRHTLEKVRSNGGGAAGLARRSGGYVLQVDPDLVDLHRFHRLLRTAHQGRPEAERAALIHTALDLWQGPPFGDVPGDWAARMRDNLVEERLDAVARWADVLVRLGRPDEVVGTVRELVTEHPLAEQLVAVLMRTLAASGRGAQALELFTATRTRLVEELGADPGQRLHEVHQAVLRGEIESAPPNQRSTTPAFTGRKMAVLDDLLPKVDGSSTAVMMSADLEQLVRAAPPRTSYGRTIRRPLTSFLGRGAELMRVTEQLTEQQLVSLIGPAGVGKTRIAVEYAAKHPDADGPWLARLAVVRQPAELPNVVADAIGLVATQGEPTAAVVRSLADRPGLLVLDNCEHVVDAVAELVMALLDGCPRLRILATSREPLGIDGETIVQVRPLPLVADDGTDGAAVALLLERVRAVRPNWTASTDDLAHARLISATLDGLPLAIELAAVRARVLGLSEIAERLSDRFAVLGAVPRGSLAPHATLEAAIAWSVELLSDVDRALLLRLWPFEGGFTLEAAAAVSPAGDTNTGTATFESLSSLVTRSVVVADTTLTPTRYLLLESIRGYCRSIDPDQEATNEAHAKWVRELAAQCPDAVRRHDGGRFRRMLSHELPNIRAGLAHDRERDPSAALRSVGQLGLFLVPIVHNAEALALVRTTMAAAPDTSTMDRARAMIILVTLSHFSGDFEDARRLLPRTLAICAELGDDEDAYENSELHYHLALASAEVGDADAAVVAADRSIAISQKHGATWFTGAARTVRAVAHVLKAHHANDETALVDAVHAAHKHSKGWPVAWADAVLAEIYLRHPGTSATGAARAADALAAIHRAVTVFLHEEDIKYAIRAVYLGALALARNDRPVDAIRLLASVRHHAKRLVILAPTFLEPGTAWVDDALAHVLPPAQRFAAEADGAQLTWPDMIALLAPR